jgi:hypothetical protein
MCVSIIINAGEKEIQTPAQFEKHFKLDSGLLDEDKELCLCNMDVDMIFYEYEIPYKMVQGDYYVGKLHLVKEDENEHFNCR